MRIIKFYYFLSVLFIISCPPKVVEESPRQPDDIPLIKTAIEVYEEAPLYAFNLIKSIQDMQYQNLKSSLILKIYLQQREYNKALCLLDSVLSGSDSLNFNLIKIHPYEINRVLIKKGLWERLLEFTDDTLLKGIAAYNLERYEQALKFLNLQKEPNDYRLLYLARIYEKMNKLDSALNTLLSIDSISTYLSDEYENILFRLLVNLNDPYIIQTRRGRLRNEELKDYLLLKSYELKKDIKEMYKKSWELIKKNPGSMGARYAINLVKPKTRLEYKLIGKVYYLKGDLENAMKNFKKSGFDSDIYYYLGKMYYDRGNREQAVRYLSRSRRADAYYYRGLIYEAQGNIRKAAEVYDSLVLLYQKSKLANRGLRRKAFLLEEIGDTNNAIKTFIGLNEKNTDLRAGLLLFSSRRFAEALDIFAKQQDPGFIYWQMRTKNILGQSIDSLKNYLSLRFPYSYYSLIREGNPVVMDTIPMEKWLKQFGDSIISFDSDDSLHLKKAIRYFEIGEFNYGYLELKSIKNKSYFDLFYLGKICYEYGADWAAIKFALELKKNLEENQSIRIFPEEFL
ncbi:MAG: tetratricopeptide repeat protein, partial [candidate division WOR-3 bacterium]